MCSLCTKSTNLKHVQEKEEEEKRLLGGELHTQTSPSGQVTAPLLLHSSDLKHSGATADDDRRARGEEDAGWAQWEAGD